MTASRHTPDGLSGSKTSTSCSSSRCSKAYAVSASTLYIHADLPVHRPFSAVYAAGAVIGIVLRTLMLFGMMRFAYLTFRRADKK